MKKRISMLIAVFMITVFTFNSFAITFNPDPGSVRDHSGNPDTVPMYGYVGEAVDNLVDPDPDDPGINPWKLNVSVPVKFLWAAFIPSDGSLTADLESPDYKIINYGEKDVKISITGFTEDVPLTNGTVDLNFTEKTPATPVFDVSLTPGSTNSLLGTLAAPVAPATESKWDFTITGEYDAVTAWSDVTQYPVYTVEFSFEIA